MQPTTTRDVDVAIIGGGLSGNLLARQLRREVPDASVALFERDTARGYKVGESTVEVAANYLLRRHQLSSYLYREHLPKFGLRYFFDSEARDTALPEMSEIGPRSAPLYPSFQLDRAKLEADLLDMNRRDGVEVHLGARVKDLTLSDTARHTFTAVGDAGERRYRARWVLDCAGREGMVAKQKGLRRPEASHRVAAGWGRFAGVRDMDSIDAPAFHARAHHSSRMLSTVHFMHDGYWIWLIPLRSGLTSVGLVQRSSDWRADRQKLDGFLRFLREHRAVAELLEQAEPVDYAAFTQLAFRTTRFFGAERWAVLGDAAAFPDPFYSPGSDFIALTADLAADLIRRELAGEDTRERVEGYDAFMHYRYQTTMAIYDGLYETFGSYELFKAKVFFDTAIYYNLVFAPFAVDAHRDLRWVRSELRRRGFGLELMQNFAGLFRRAAAELKQRGAYRRHNRGHAELDAFKAFGIITDVGKLRTRREVNAQNEFIFRQTQQMVLDAVGSDSPLAPSLSPASNDLFDAWSSLSAAS